MKNLSALVIALIFIFSLLPAAFAAESDGAPPSAIEATWADPTQELAVELDGAPLSLAVCYGPEDWEVASEGADYKASDAGITLLPELITDASGEVWPDGMYLLSVGSDDASWLLVLTIKGLTSESGIVVFEDDRISMTYTGTDEAGVHFDLVNRSDVEISIIFDSIAINGHSYDLSSGDYGSTSIMAQSTGEITQNINEDYDLEVSTLSAAFRYGAAEDPGDEAAGSFMNIDVLS